MKTLLTVVSATCMLLLSAQGLAGSDRFYALAQANDNLPQPKIVGGEVAEANNWPWMTAFVVTFEDVSTSLQVAGVTYTSTAFTFSPSGTVSGEVVACGLGQEICSNAENKVCLIERGDINFSVKADNCEAGGGIGVIIYNNVEGQISGTLGGDFTGTIPVVAVTQDDGLSILDQVGSIANLSVSTLAALAQDASCGATFLGDKWVLTAAHCVDSDTAGLFKMNVGEYDLSDGAENAIAIANIYIHPLYDEDLINNDLAIVELVSSVNTPAVQIADPEVTDQLAIENSLATVAGWGGRLGYAPGQGPTGDFPDILHKVDLFLSTNQECRDALGATLGRPADTVGISDAMICAAIPEGGKGSCQGDSGGPLIVLVNNEPQQVGIVSWGIGCAEPGYPGVFTRVSEFKEWLSTISDGIAITQLLDFGVSPQDTFITSTLRVANNSEVSVGLTYSIDGAAEFSIDAGVCEVLDADASCEITVNYQPTAATEVEAYVVITSDDPSVATSRARLKGSAIAPANNLDGIAGSASNNVSWFSGGALSWTANSISGVQSGAIDDLEESVLMAVIEGEGQLNFEWSVSSEENADEPDEPFDALHLYVNDNLIDFISGEVAFTAHAEINLPAGANRVMWIYSKDQNTREGDDKGLVRNVEFTPVAVPDPDPIPLPDPEVTPRSSGGGSIAWLSLWLFGLVVLRRK
ncbi:MAG: secreted trypsin-like serine protease [Paraglaciecola sp.]|jgi:secreted trypsin-like serine protease